MVVYKHVSMTCVLALRKPTQPQSFMLIYGFIFELWMSNLNEEEKKKMKNSAHHSPIHLLENKKLFELKRRGYRDGIKRKETR